MVGLELKYTAVLHTVDDDDDDGKFVSLYSSFINISGTAQAAELQQWRHHYFH